MTSKHEPQSGALDSGWLSIRDAAEHFGVSHHTIRRWIREGRITAEQHDGPHGVQYLIPLPQPDPRDAAKSTVVAHPGMPALELVGRDREVELISGAMREAVAGTFRLVVLSGEAGIGKTSMVMELRRRARQLGLIVMIGNCYELENTPPYGPWIELLRSYTPSPMDPSPPAVDALSVQELGSSAELHRAIEKFFGDLAASNPVLIVLEDFHWSDQSSLDLLRSLARALWRCPVMVLMTYRDDELLVEQPLHRLLPTLIRETGAVRVRLGPLGQADVEELVRRRYAADEAVQRELSDYLWRYSEGIPFYVDELATHLENEGGLVREDGSWTLTAPPQVDVPPLVRQVAINRFTTLPADARLHLQIAAAVGVEAALDLLQMITDAPVAELAASIDLALRARLIDEDPAKQCIRFRHALIREALYGNLLVLHRRAIHRDVAEALTSFPDADPDIVAHHFSQAQDDRAAEWLLAAGRRAAMTFAYRDTIARFEQALSILERGPGSDVTRAWVLCELAIAYRYIDPHRALELISVGLDLATRHDDVALVSVLRRSRAHIRGFIGENGLPELRESLAMFEQLPAGERQRIEQSSLGHAVSGGAYAQRIAYYAQYQEARRLADEFLDTAPYPLVKRDHYEIGLAHLALGLSHANLGDPDAALAAFSRSRDSFSEASNNYLYGMALTHEYNHVVQVYFPELVAERRRLIAAVDEAFSRSVMAYLAHRTQIARLYNALVLDGHWNEARDSALALVDNAYMRVECSSILTIIDYLQGRYDYAWEWVRRAIPDGPQAEPGTVYHHDIVQVQQVAVHLALQAGDFDLAECWIHAHDRWRCGSDSVIGKHTLDLLWAEFYRASGDIERASTHAGQALSLVQSPRQPFAILHASRLLGELAQESGSTNEATRYLSLAVDLSRTFEAPFEIALSQIASAETLLATGGRQEAEPALREARVLLESLGARPALERLQTIEQRISTAAERHQIAAGLSPRELEVLQLVATGLTDAEIAERLFISPRTVGGHLQSIYQKTGVSSRTAATAYAYTHGLAKATN